MVGDDAGRNRHERNDLPGDRTRAIEWTSADAGHQPWCAGLRLVADLARPRRERCGLLLLLAGCDPGWLALDLSSVPAAKRGRVVVGWYNDPQTSPYDHSVPGEEAYNNLRDYTLQANPAASGGAAPTSGWVTLASVTGNPSIRASTSSICRATTGFG